MTTDDWKRTKLQGETTLNNITWHCYRRGAIETLSGQGRRSPTKQWGKALFYPARLGGHAIGSPPPWAIKGEGELSKGQMIRIAHTCNSTKHYTSYARGPSLEVPLVQAFYSPDTNVIIGYTDTQLDVGTFVTVTNIKPLCHPCIPSALDAQST